MCSLTVYNTMNFLTRRESIITLLQVTSPSSGDHSAVLLALFIVLLAALIANDPITIAWRALHDDGRARSSHVDSEQVLRGGIEWLWRIHGGP